MSSSTEVIMTSGLTGAIPFREQPQWYAVRTRSRHEKLVSLQLEMQGIETFLPLVRRTRKWSDRIKEVELPLFSGYNFVRIDLSSSARMQVLKASGVVSFVGSRGAESIPESQIRDIRTVLNYRVPFEEDALPAVGQRVRIRGGALDGVEGVLAANNSNQSLTIRLEPIQRSISIRIQGYQLEAA